jgi:hypothetical protein
MTSVADALQTQIKNIEARSGKSMAEWTKLLRASGLTKHAEMIAFLKTKHGMSHGDANRTALVARAVDADAPPATSLKPGVAEIHAALLAAIGKLGKDVELAPKKGYTSIRRAKQFAMVKPAAKHVDVGLILRDAKPTERLEASGSFNAMFTHRVRVASPAEVDKQLLGWLRAAYAAAE